MVKPLAIDLFCGLGGWSEGLLAEGYDVIGFDIEQHIYGEHRYLAQLVLQDVLTLHGRQFKDAALIVASPPCQAYSYRAMPWKRAKALPPPDNSLFEACFRIQAEATEAAGRYVPMVVENVCGAQKWVGRARWHYGSYYLWGDVPALMPMVQKVNKVNGFRFDGSGRSFQTAAVEGVKVGGLDWSKHADPDYKTSGASGCFRDSAIKNTGVSWFTQGNGSTVTRANPRDDIKSSDGDNFWIETTRGSHHGSTKRKAASALIAKIPLALSRHIAKVYYPRKAA